MRQPIKNKIPNPFVFVLTDNGSEFKNHLSPLQFMLSSCPIKKKYMKERRDGEGNVKLTISLEDDGVSQESREEGAAFRAEDIPEGMVAGRRISADC